MVTNPVDIYISGDSQGCVICHAHAAFYQRVTLTWTIGQRTESVVFEGSGEGVPMKTAGGETIHMLPLSRQGYTISALFEYSRSGSTGPFSRAKVNSPIISTNGHATVVTVTGTQFNNGSCLVVSFRTLRSGSKQHS